MIYQIPDDKQYWVMRADSGRYYNHFKKHGVMALAHIDVLDLDETPDAPYNPSILEIKSKLGRKHRELERKKATTTSHLNQVVAFIKKVTIGDWVLAIGDEYVCFGRVIGHPYISRTPVSITFGRRNEYEVLMEHNLRRNVLWSVEMKRSELPPSLLRSMRAYQAIFNVDQHWEAIHHTLYPVFTRNDRVFFSTKIRSEERVNNYHLTNILSYLNELEILSKNIDDQDLTVANFDGFYNELALQNRVTTTTKAEFHSPGDIWTALSACISPEVGYCILGYSALFGNRILGVDGIFDLKTRQRFYEILASRIEKHEIKATSEKLELDAPRHDTSRLESAQLDADPIPDDE